ncbi:MAG: hypothetical protein OQJ84_04010 [Xanthomonadales bacterium]|nr:hypothetical protein [Xanthomonadales bacterium]
MTNMEKLTFGILLISTSPITFAAPSPNAIVTVPQAIPAISQAGLIGLAFVVGIIGASLIRKYKAADK